MRACTVLLLTACLCGCHPAVPSLVGGKPLQHWLEKLHSHSPSLRRQAVAKLANVGPSDPAVIPAVLKTLRDPDAGVRRAAIFAVVRLGPDAYQALPTLQNLARHDKDKTVRQCAHQAVARLQDR